MEDFNEKQKKVDATNISIVPKSVRRLYIVGKNEAERDIFQDSYGRRYHRITNDPADQMFVARLLKGILPISDVLYNSEKKIFYSYETAEDTLTVEWRNNPELWADDCLLSFLFSDPDHWGMNVLGDERSHALYDFENFADFWKFVPTFTNMREHVENANSVQLTALKTRLNILRMHCEGDKGREFILTIVRSMRKEGAGVPKVLKAHTGVDLAGHITAFQKELLNRIDLLNAVIEEGETHSLPSEK